MTKALGHNIRSTKTRIETSKQFDEDVGESTSQYKIHQNKDWN